MKTRWTTKLLQEVAIFQRGTSITKKQVTSGNIPVIAGGQKPAYFHNQKNREANSITISTSGAYAGFVSFHPHPVFASDCFTVESKPESLNQKFLFHFLKFKQKEIYNMQSGDAQPHVYVRNFNDFEVSFPSLKEQQRIVEILDESFAKLETAHSNTAVNLESSKELFLSILDESLSDAEEKGWETKPLGDLCRIELGSTPARKFPKNWDTEKQTDNVWLSIADLPVGFDSWVSDSKEYVSALAAETIKTVPAGTLMVSFKLTLGRVAIASKDLRTNEAIASMIDLDTSLCNRNYLLWYFRFYDWNSAAAGEEKVKGKTLNKAKLKVLPVILPPLEEQQRVVKKLDSLGEKTDSLQQQYTSQLADMDELRQSLLQKAFAGELT